MTTFECGKGPEPKPERLYHRTYLQLLKNSVGTTMFRNFYVRTSEMGEFDALDNGSNSCAFYVSGVLVIFKKLEAVHGTIASTIQDLNKSGWQKVPHEADMQPGDVLVWEARKFPDGTYGHIGFALEDGQAVSTSWTEGKVVTHDLHFGDANRAITQIYRTNW